MLSNLKQKIAKKMASILPQAIYEQYKKYYDSANQYAQVYYSQEGEEIILRRYFNYKNTGFFVDVGACHPIRFSNTYKLYQLGWRGINIDATPKAMKNFLKYRPFDINVEAAVSDKIENLTYYCFNESALNTFDTAKAEEIIQSGHYTLNSKENIQTQTLVSLLDRFLPPNQAIDFFSIDVEGFDYKVLQSNNWDKYRPQLIIVETDLPLIQDVLKSPIASFLNEHHYFLFAKTGKSAFFCSNNQG